MKQEQKELLLKDLCGRLLYGVKVNAPFTSNKNENAKGYKINGINFGVVEWTSTLFGEKKRRNRFIIETFSEKYNQYCSMDIELNNDIERVKLYLFPLSSMSEEQKKEYHELIGGMFGTSTLINFEALEDFFNKNHIDYRGLIEKGLAIDATGLNIY